MSWLQGIAGKAEDLLNRVDQSAATALQNNRGSSSSHSSPSRGAPEGSALPFYADRSSLTRSMPPSDFRPTSSTAPPERRLSNPGIRVAGKKTPASDDEKLMEFLNFGENLPPSPPRKAKPVTEQKKTFDVSESQKSENSASYSETFVEVPPRPVTTLQVLESESAQILDDIEMSSSRTTPEDSASSESFEVVDGPAAKTSAAEDDILKYKKKLEEAENEMKKTREKVDRWNSQVTGTVAREFQERERDLAATIDAKDSQLAVLKVRLEEADQELQVKRKAVQDLRFENEKMIKEHAQTAAHQNKAIESLQVRLQQVESELSKTKDALVQTQTGYMQKVGNMEEEHRHLMDNYSSLQKKWNDLSDRNKDLLSQLKYSNGNFETLQQEYNDYKQKAQRILQSKEKLICSLKEGNVDAEAIEKNESASALLNAEIESAKQERDSLKEDLRRANELVEAYRGEIQELEKMLQNDSLANQERCKSFADELVAEKAQKDEIMLLNGTLKDELQALREELVSSKNSLHSRIQDREIEIEKLRRQLTAKSLSTVGQDELESRLHALTENLIQKQTLVEALSTEKNSLVLQLERLELQLRDAQNCNFQQHSYVGINTNDSDRKTKPVFLENPFDSALTRRAKKVYGTIDSFSIRLGVFFRRYPIARVFVIIYMLLLHFWVMIVLLTYEPEVHSPSYEISKHQQ